MASYRVLIKASAAKEIEAVDPKKDRQRIVAAIRSLADDPRPAGCEKLAGDDELLVFVVRVGHRKDVYR